MESTKGKNEVKKISFGQAVDIAKSRHERFYPESAVYSANVAEGDSAIGDCYKVEVRASHFSVPILYCVQLDGYESD